MTNLSHLSLWNQEVVCEFAWSFVIAPIHPHTWDSLAVQGYSGFPRTRGQAMTHPLLHRPKSTTRADYGQTGWTNTLGHFVIFVFSFFFFEPRESHVARDRAIQEGGSLRTESEEMIRPVCFIGNILELFFGVFFCLFVWYPTWWVRTE